MDINEVRHLDACIYLTFREEERRHFPVDVSATNQVRDMTIKRPFCWLASTHVQCWVRRLLVSKCTCGSSRTHCAIAAASTCLGHNHEKFHAGSMTRWSVSPSTTFCLKDPQCFSFLGSTSTNTRSVVIRK